MTDVLSNVQAVLNNPLVKQGIRVASPEVALGLEIIEGLFAKPMREASEVLKVIDKRLAELLKQLAESKSKLAIRELEVRIHELLEILNEWSKT